MDRQQRQHRRPNDPNHDDDDDPFFGPILRYYHSLPPISRTWFTLSVVITSLNTLEVLDAHQLTFRWERIAPPHLELWRMLTSFCWAGPGTMLDFSVLLLLYSMTSVVPDYENDPHEATRGRRSPGGRGRLADCVFAFLICSVLILASHLLLVKTPFLVASAVAPIRQLLIPIFDDDGPVLLPIFTRTLLYSIITLDAARHPDKEHSINFFPVPGRYVPIFHVAFGVLMGYRNNEVVHGIVVGLAYHLLVTDDGPLASWMGGEKRAIICAPDWLVRLVDGEDGALGGVFADYGNDVANDGGIPLEPGANLLHRAAAVSDVDYVRGRIDRLVADGGASSPPAVTLPFRHGDRNGWQPLHEAARSGHLEVLAMLLEVDRRT